jgi:Ca-activated chloride channel family protein
VFLTALTSGVGSRPAQEPTEPFRFRTEVRAVLVPFSVKDGSGKPVSGLPASAFTVLDQGVERPVVFFDERDEPLSVVLVVDASSSMRGGRLVEAKRAARTFVDRIASNAGNEISPPIGELALVAFDHGIRHVRPWIADERKLLDDIDAIEAGGGTALFDAIETALELVEEATNRRRAVVVLSDGKDEDSGLGFGALRQQVEASDASLFAVGFYTGEERRWFTPGRQYFKQPPFEVNLNPAWVLAELAGATGGIALFPAESQDLAPLFETIAAELRHQYVLGFEPGDGGGGASGFRTIDVRVSSPDHPGPLTVRGRRGYSIRSGGTGVSPAR